MRLPGLLCLLHGRLLLFLGKLAPSDAGRNLWLVTDTALYINAYACMCTPTAVVDKLATGTSIQVVSAALLLVVVPRASCYATPGVGAFGVRCF